MKKLLILPLLLIVGLAAGAVAQIETPSADAEILGQMDFHRFAAYFDFKADSPSTTFTVDIIAERIQGTFTATVQVSFKIIDGKFFARIDYLAPEDLTGQVFIATPDGIYFWKPDLAETGAIRVPGDFEVFGDATVAEVVGIGFQGQYKIVKREDNVDIGGGKTGVKLELEGANDQVTFPFAVVTAEGLKMGETTSYRPYTLQLFGLDRNDPFHFNTFEEYGEQDGLPYFKRQLLDNLITVENQTLLDVSHIVKNTLENDYFDPKLLGK